MAIRNPRVFNTPNHFLRPPEQKDLQTLLFPEIQAHDILARNTFIKGSNVFRKRNTEFAEGAPLVQLLAREWKLPSEIVEECKIAGVFRTKLWDRTHYEQATKIVVSQEKPWKEKTATSSSGYPSSNSTYLYLDGIPYKIRHRKAVYDPQDKSEHLMLSFRKHPQLPIGYVLVISFVKNAGAIQETVTP